MTTVHVPVVPDSARADYVSRVYTYDVYGICRKKSGKVQPDSEQRIGGGRIPYNSGDYRLRIPPSERTTFTFTESVELLIHPPPRGVLAPVVCPTKQTPSLYRLHIDELDVYASSFGSLDVPVDVNHYFPEPATSKPGKDGNKPGKVGKP